jgi:hypothetical protein
MEPGSDVVKDSVQKETPAGPPLLFSVETARTVPYWFFALVGLVYASGFVVVELYLASFGLRDVGTEFWKARYIHVGVLCSIFPILPVLSCALIYKTVKLRDESNTRLFFWIRVINGVMIFLVPQMAFYVVVFFGRRSAPTDPHYVGFPTLVAILLTALVGSLPIVVIEKFLRYPPAAWSFPKALWGKVGMALRLLQVCIFCVEFVILISQYSSLLWEMIANHYLPFGTFILCTISIPAFPILRTWYAGQRGYPNLAALTVCFSIPVYYLGLITFASSMFAYLPANRGGGDYTVAPQVILELNADISRDVVTKEFLEPDAATTNSSAEQAAATKKTQAKTEKSDARPSPPSIVTRRCILIEETANALFIAVPSEAGGPQEWRKSQTKRPSVLAIDRKSIVAIKYFNL